MNLKCNVMLALSFVCKVGRCTEIGYFILCRNFLYIYKRNMCHEASVNKNVLPSYAHESKRQQLWNLLEKSVFLHSYPHLVVSLCLLCFTHDKYFGWSFCFKSKFLYSSYIFSLINVCYHFPFVISWWNCIYQKYLE